MYLLSIYRSGGSGKYLYKHMTSEICELTALKKQDKAVSLKALFPTSGKFSVYLFIFFNWSLFDFYYNKDIFMFK